MAESILIAPSILAANFARLGEEVGLQVATPADAREILSLKGGDKVAF